MEAIGNDWYAHEEICTAGKDVIGQGDVHPSSCSEGETRNYIYLIIISCACRGNTIAGKSK